MILTLHLMALCYLLLEQPHMMKMCLLFQEYLCDALLTPSDGMIPLFLAFKSEMIHSINPIIEQETEIISIMKHLDDRVNYGANRLFIEDAEISKRNQYKKLKSYLEFPLPLFTFGNEIKPHRIRIECFSRSQNEKKERKMLHLSDENENQIQMSSASPIQQQNSEICTLTKKGYRINKRVDQDSFERTLTSMNTKVSNIVTDTSKTNKYLIEYDRSQSKAHSGSSNKLSNRMKSDVNESRSLSSKQKSHFRFKLLPRKMKGEETERVASSLENEQKDRELKEWNNVLSPRENNLSAFETNQTPPTKKSKRFSSIRTSNIIATKKRIESSFSSGDQHLGKSYNSASGYFTMKGYTPRESSSSRGPKQSSTIGNSIESNYLLSALDKSSYSNYAPIEEYIKITTEYSRDSKK